MRLLGLLLLRPQGDLRVTGRNGEGKRVARHLLLLLRSDSDLRLRLLLWFEVRHHTLRDCVEPNWLLVRERLLVYKLERLVPLQLIHQDARHAIDALVKTLEFEPESPFPRL